VGTPLAAATAARAGDAESLRWLHRLGSPGRDRDAALTELHALLLRFARAQVAQRAARFHVHGPEADDLAHQAAADALLAMTAKLGEFRGESRFTTWAYKFVLLEVSSKLGRHFWRAAAPSPDVAEWERLPDLFGLDPGRESEWRDLLAALRRAVESELTPRQRRLFVDIVFNQVPLDALCAQLGTNRNAVYKGLFDARRKVRASLVANGYLPADNSRAP
jgi:RNA polymerase sigma-70 factor (ECF subfamily)